MMTSINHTQVFNWTLPGDLIHVEQVCTAIAQKLDEYPFQKKDRFAVELLLRESLNNAVIHGCHQNSLLSISCSLMISNIEVVIKVSDEGKGFNWRKQSRTHPNNSDESGRGLSIYAMYARDVQFNDAGNSVRMTRILNHGDNNE